VLFKRNKRRGFISEHKLVKIVIIAENLLRLFFCQKKKILLFKILKNMPFILPSVAEYYELSNAQICNLTNKIKALTIKNYSNILL